MVAFSIWFDQGGTNVRISGRFALCVAATLALSGIVCQRAGADVMYSVTDLGQAAPATGGLLAGLVYGATYPAPTLYPNGNYLGALSQSQQAAFQSGSFDIYAHPATVGNLPVFYSPGDGVQPPENGNGYYTYSGFNMTTSNNLGVNAGTANTMISAIPGGGYTSGVIFTPDPHTVYVPDSSSNPSGPSTPVTSPGYLGGFAYSSQYGYGVFYGVVAGINDHNNLAFSEFTFATPGATLVTAHLSTGTGDTSLGTLGGTNSAAYALNNSNQVVGWSQIASGAQHAFLYSNGTMQDLNLLIPPLSGITLTSAVGIDAAGEIVAIGTDAAGQTNEYFLTPVEAAVPEPSTFAIVGLMIVAVAARQAYSRQHAKS